MIIKNNKNNKLPDGPWKFGWFLDEYSISSKLTPEGRFDTKRTEIGEMIYQLKYCNNIGVAEKLAEIAADFIKKLKVYEYL